MTVREIVRICTQMAALGISESCFSPIESTESAALEATESSESSVETAAETVESSDSATESDEASEGSDNSSDTCEDTGTSSEETSETDAAAAAVYVLDSAAEHTVQCCNHVLQALYENFTALKKAEVEAIGGFISTAGIGDFGRVISLMRNGCDVSFRYSVGGLHVNFDGVYTLVYAAKAQEVGWTDEVVLPTPSLSERVLAYGIISEFFFTMGDFMAAKIWEIRFEDGVHAAARKSSVMRLPVGRWL